MFDRLSNDEITNALDELITCLGIKEEMASQDFTALLQKGDTQGCVQEIATRLGLPICIELSYIPKGFSSGNTNTFRSSALARRDPTGHNIESIAAQVSIPKNLPMFGTSGLQGYSIQVLVSENCRAQPDTFVAIMVHELSHVLLASLYSTHKESELYADLVPIILGFRDIVRKGRKIITSTTRENATTTLTNTYGYLTDSQFEFACNQVMETLRCHLHCKNRLIELVKQVQRKNKEAAQSLATFRDYLRYLDGHPPKRMRMEHAEKVVQMHGGDYTREWESRITVTRKSKEAAEAFARSLNHYTTGAIELLNTHTRVLELASDELDRVTEAITKDERTMQKYVGFLHRLQKELFDTTSGNGDNSSQH